MQLKIIKIICRALSIIYHTARKQTKLKNTTEEQIMLWVDRHNNLVDGKRNKDKHNTHRYQYITYWQYTWDLDRGGRLYGKIYTDTTVD